MKRFATLIALMLAMLCACGQDTAQPLSWEEQYNMGIRYLSEGNYEEAIIAFSAAIEIDPKQPDAYIGLADAYVEMGKYDDARDVLTTGFEATQATSIKSKLQTLSVDLPALSSDDLAITKQLYDYLKNEDYTSIRSMVECLDCGDVNLDSFFNEKIGGLFLFDGNDFHALDDGYGLVMIEGGLVFGEFHDGLPNGECTILSMFSNTQTGYTRVSGNFENGIFTGEGTMCTVWHDEYDEHGNHVFNGRERYCQNWKNGLAIGDVVLTNYNVGYYGYDSLNNEVIGNSINEDHIKTDENGEYQEGYRITVEDTFRPEDEGSTYDLSDNFGYTADLTHYICADQLTNNGYYHWKDSSGEWLN